MLPSQEPPSTTAVSLLSLLLPLSWVRTQYVPQYSSCVWSQRVSRALVYCIVSSHLCVAARKRRAVLLVCKVGENSLVYTPIALDGVAMPMVDGCGLLRWVLT